MTTLNDAKSAWERASNQFRKNTPTRRAFLGDGRGNATSNIVVADNPTMFYARENLTDEAYFVVPNFNAGVNPQFNLPVVLGFDQINPNIEQILGVDMSVFPYESSTSILGGIGSHHTQHEFGGGDEVFVDAELIKVGLFSPNNPPDFSGYVQPFYYSHSANGLVAFPGSYIDSLEPYKPSASATNKFVTVALNPDTGALVYRPGTELVNTGVSSVGLADLLEAGGSIAIGGGSATFPPVAGGEIPLVTFNLTSTTTSLSWSATNSPYYSTRLFLGKIDTDIYARLENLETKVGLNTLPTTGATRRALVENRNVHDGDFRIGRINPPQISGTSSPSWGNKLFFSGALGTYSWNSENSDPQWIARYNADNDVSYLRVNIGDNNYGLDKFQVGYTVGGVYTPVWSVTDGGVTKTTSSSTGTTTIADNVDVHFCESSASYVVTLPNQLGGKQIRIVNRGTGMIQIVPQSGSIGASSLQEINYTDNVLLTSDGSNWW